MNSPLNINLFPADEKDCCVKRDRFVSLVKEITGASSYMTDFMAKVLDGNILYTPNNTKTRRVMDKVSLFFEMVFMRCSLFLIYSSQFILFIYFDYTG